MVDKKKCQLINIKDGCSFPGNKLLLILINPPFIEPWCLEFLHSPEVKLAWTYSAQFSLFRRISLLFVDSWLWSRILLHWRSSTGENGRAVPPGDLWFEDHVCPHRLQSPLTSFGFRAADLRDAPTDSSKDRGGGLMPCDNVLGYFARFRGPAGVTYF